MATIEYWQGLLTAIEARIEGRALSDTQRYQIGDRELEHIPIGDLTKTHDWASGQLRRAQAALNGSSNKVVPRF
jgi:hypothetical protein